MHNLKLRYSGSVSPVINISFDVMWFEMLKVSLNKQRINDCYEGPSSL
jgi:hypothetical protein